jgi:methionyl aminopeptidase
VSVDSPEQLAGLKRVGALRDVGAAVERETRRHGFSVIRELTGHGIGHAMHEEPTVFNWAAPAARIRLTAGSRASSEIAG